MQGQYVHRQHTQRHQAKRSRKLRFAEDCICNPWSKDKGEDQCYGCHAENDHGRDAIEARQSWPVFLLTAPGGKPYQGVVHPHHADHEHDVHHCQGEEIDANIFRTQDTGKDHIHKKCHNRGRDLYREYARRRGKEPLFLVFDSSGNGIEHIQGKLSLSFLSTSG